MDFAQAGLLDGLSGSDRAARLAYLESLEAAGFTLQEMLAAAEANRLALLPVERLLRGQYTGEEYAARAGLPLELLIRIRRLLGLAEIDPGDRVFSEFDVDAGRALRRYLEAGFSEQSVDEIARVLGESMARVSQATIGAFTQAFLRAGDTEEEVAWRFAEEAENLIPLLDPLLASGYRAHLRDWIGLGTISRDDLSSGQVANELELAVCFADLVGFTRLGGEVEPGELDQVISVFGRLAADAAGKRVRLVKTIGDAAMFSSADPDRLVSASLDLLEAVEAAELPGVRAGIAFGTAVPRSGDLYGAAVNLASRVTGVARPGSVLCTQEVHDAAPDFDWSFARRHRLKGIGEAVPLYRARRRAADDGGGAGERVGE